MFFGIGLNNCRKDDSAHFKALYYSSQASPVISYRLDGEEGTPVSTTEGPQLSDSSGDITATPIYIYRP